MVEVGAYRGVTTEKLAHFTDRMVIAVDPFKGYGGAAKDYQLFKRRTESLSNVIHLRRTSGEAARDWPYSRPGCVFIDAVHDYVNTWHDALVWGHLVRNRGLLCFHDTDEKQFAGTRRAVYHIAKFWQVWGSCENLVILRKPSSGRSAEDVERG